MIQWIQFTPTVLSIQAGAVHHQMFKRFLTREVPGYRTLSQLLQETKWALDVDRLIRIVSRGPRLTDTDAFIRSILDGPIDVDKVSYLLYDSYFTGARYGLGIDLDGFLSSLVAIPKGVGGAGQSHIGISSTGVVAAEGVISARYSMFSRVYWHHFNRAIMTMLKYAAAKLFLSPDGSCPFDRYVDETFDLSDFEAVRYIHNRLGEVIASKNSNPLRGLLDGSRTIHKRFLTFSGASGSGTRSIHRLLTNDSFQTLEERRLEVLTKLSAKLGEDFEDHEVLFDVPRSEKTGETLESLYVYDPEDRAEKYRTLSTLSGVTRALCDEFEGLTKKSRVFVSPRLQAKLEGDTRRTEVVKTEIEEDLRGAAARQNY